MSTSVYIKWNRSGRHDTCTVAFENRQQQQEDLPKQLIQILSKTYKLPHRRPAVLKGSHNLSIPCTKHTRPKARGLPYQHRPTPIYPTIAQRIREHHLNSRLTRPPRLVGILVRHEHNRHVIPTVRDLRAPGIAAMARRTVRDVPMAPGLAVIIRHDILETEVMTMPRSLKHHDERLSPARSNIPHPHNPLHPIAQALRLAMAPQASRPRPSRPRIARNDTVRLLVIVGVLAGIRKMDLPSIALQPHKRLPESHSADRGTILLSGLARELPRPPAVEAATHRDAEVGRSATTVEVVVAEGGEHDPPPPPVWVGDLKQKPVVDVLPHAPRDLPHRREAPPVVVAARYLQDAGGAVVPRRYGEEGPVREAR